MYPVSVFRPLGLISIIIVASGLTFLLRKWPQNSQKTFSQHAAAHRDSIVYYSGLFGIVLPLLLFFFIGWFVPAEQVSRWFIPLIGLSAIFQFSVTLIPEVGGWRSTTHRILTFCSAILMPPSLLLVIVATHGIKRYVCCVGLAIMLTGLALAWKFKDGHRYTLPLQASYYAAFFAAILYVAYL